MAKCLIAGLPAAGKSTYIGALAYMLQNPVQGQLFSLAKMPDDMSYINKLTGPWLSQEKLDRTTSGYVNSIEFTISNNNDNSTMHISIPDMAGEDFAAIVQKNPETIKKWSEDPDSLFFLINQWPNHILAENFGDTEPEDKSVAPPQFNLNSMSVDVQNILLLKELHNLFPWKKIAIGLSSWDLYKDSFSTPIEIIEQRSKFLYNFIMHYFPEAYIFGVSAQGAEYSKDENLCEELMSKTEKGERSYIVTPEGKQVYDITLPLKFLI